MAPSASKADARADLGRALRRRFEPSQVEIRDPARAGTVTRRGTLLTLAADRVPAKPFRVVAVGGGREVRRHIMDFARVEISEDGRVRAESTLLTIPRGTRMVVLETKLVGNEVRMLAHTADPLEAQPRGNLIYGCTEFVFHFAPAILEAGSVEPIADVIEHWLEGPPGERVCRGGLTPLCIEP